MEWAVKPFYRGCVLWLCDEPSFKEEKSCSITDRCAHLRISSNHTKAGTISAKLIVEDNLLR